MRKKHGHARKSGRTPTYNSWRCMRERVNRVDHDSYMYYGGRGIKVDPEWDSFTNFVRDMGLRPDGMTIDRIDPMGHYTKSNCRWATAKTQARNRRNAC